jgi:arsenate reductase-like glutaredoxin family protein
MIVIHHNPECATSRNVLSIIEASGATPVVIDYPRPAGRVRICWGSSRPPASLHAPRSALRTTKSPAEDLGLLDPAVPDHALPDAMLAHPILVGGAWASAARHWTGLAVPRAGRQRSSGLDHESLPEIWNQTRERICASTVPMPNSRTSTVCSTDATSTSTGLSARW